MPKLLAAATLAQRPEHYGFRPPSPDEVIETRPMPIERPLSLEKIAQVCGIDGATLWHNPTLKQGITPPSTCTARSTATTQGDTRDLRRWLSPSSLLKTTASSRPIGSGEATPSGIAKRWGAKVSEIVLLNNITTRTTLRLGQKADHPDPGA